MSFPVSALVWAGSRAVGTERCVLLSLAWHANDAGIAWPGIKRLAEHANVDPRTVQRALRCLVAADELEIRWSVREFGRNEYRIRIGVLRAAMACKAPDAEVTPPDLGVAPPDNGVVVTPVSPTPDAGVADPLTLVSPKHSLNQQEQAAKRARRSGVSLQDFLDQCKAEGRAPIPEDAAVFGLADRKGVPHDLIVLAWEEFKRHHLLGGKCDAKQYTDWAKAFRNAVDSNWYGLWWVNHDNIVEITSKGREARLLHEHPAAEHHADRMAA